MDRKFIFKRFSPKGKGAAITLIISLVILSLFNLTAYGQEPTDDSVAPEGSQAIVLVAVPETEPVINSAFLAANPELLKINLTTERNINRTGAYYVAAQRYKFVHGLGIEADVENEASASIVLAANPEFIEIMRLRRDAKAAETKAQAAFLAANPELMVAGRYKAMVEWTRLHHPGR